MEYAGPRWLRQSGEQKLSNLALVTPSDQPPTWTADRMAGYDWRFRSAELTATKMALMMASPATFHHVGTAMIQIVSPPPGVTRLEREREEDAGVVSGRLRRRRCG
jgi:hypothetical protein